PAAQRRGPAGPHPRAARAARTGVSCGRHAGLDRLPPAQRDRRARAACVPAGGTRVPPEPDRMTHEERERLRHALVAAGFDEVRFAAITPAARAPAASFSEWLEAGHHADMAWLPAAAEKRLEPERVLPGARTMIALGVNHRPAGTAATQQRWAKYAMWSDYHDTILRGLRAAGAVLETQHGLRRED